MENLELNESVRQFLELLTENGRQDQAADFSRLVWSMDAMERQYDAVLQELQEVKQRLSQIKEPRHPIKEALGGVVQALEARASQLREQMQAIRDKIVACAENTVKGFKQAGVSALDRAVSVLGIKAALENVQKGLHQSMVDTKAAISRVEAMGGELRSAGVHLKNVGRAVTGKEVRQAGPGVEGRLQSAILAPVRTTHKLLSQMNNTALAAIWSVKRLEQVAEAGRGKRVEKKPSVRQALVEKKAEVIAQAAPALKKEDRRMKRHNERG